MTNYLTCILLLVLSVTTTSAQTLTDVPKCSSNDALTNINNTGCQISNLKCICNDKGWLAKLLPQVQKDCSPADLAKTIAFTQNLCKTVGVELNIPALNSTTAVESETPTSATASAAATKAKGEENAAIVFGAPMWGAGGLMGTVGAGVVVCMWYGTI